MRHKSFLLASRIRAEMIRRTGRRVFVHLVQRCLVTAEYRSRYPTQCPRRTPVYRHRRHILPHKHWNWNHQQWPLVLFDDESIVSLYNCNGHARVFCHAVKNLAHCCIQETGGIRRHDDQSGRGCPWTHHLISHETSADGSSLRACLPTCGGSSDDQSGVSLVHRPECLERYPAATKHPWTTQRQQGIQVRLISSTLILDAKRKLFLLIIRKRTWFPFDVIVCNSFQHRPWVRLYLLRTRCRTF